MDKKRFVAVIGGSCPTPEASKLAEDVGRELARRGAILICGGLGGVMEAACKGASEEGGMTVGIIPGENRQSANAYVQVPIVTGAGYARNVFVVKSAQAVIAIEGGYGTLSEIGHALQSGIPVIGLNTWAPVKNCQPDNSIIPAESAVDAVSKALDIIEATSPV